MKEHILSILSKKAKSGNSLYDIHFDPSYELSASISWLEHYIEISIQRINKINDYNEIGILTDRIQGVIRTSSKLTIEEYFDIFYWLRLQIQDVTVIDKKGNKSQKVNHFIKGIGGFYFIFEVYSVLLFLFIKKVREENVYIIYLDDSRNHKHNLYKKENDFFMSPLEKSKNNKYFQNQKYRIWICAKYNFNIDTYTNLCQMDFSCAFFAHKNNFKYVDLGKEIEIMNANYTISTFKIFSYKKFTRAIFIKNRGIQKRYSIGEKYDGGFRLIGIENNQHLYIEFNFLRGKLFQVAESQFSDIIFSGLLDQIAHNTKGMIPISQGLVIIGGIIPTLVMSGVLVATIELSLDQAIDWGINWSVKQGVITEESAFAASILVNITPSIVPTTVITPTSRALNRSTTIKSDLPDPGAPMPVGIAPSILPTSTRGTIPPNLNSKPIPSEPTVITPISRADHPDPGAPMPVGIAPSMPRSSRGTIPPKLNSKPIPSEPTVITPTRRADPPDPRAPMPVGVAPSMPRSSRGTIPPKLNSKPIPSEPTEITATSRALNRLTTTESDPPDPEFGTGWKEVWLMPGHVIFALKKTGITNTKYATSIQQDNVGEYLINNVLKKKFYVESEGIVIGEAMMSEIKIRITRPVKVWMSKLKKLDDTDKPKSKFKTKQSPEPEPEVYWYQFFHSQGLEQFGDIISNDAIGVIKP